MKRPKNTFFEFKRFRIDQAQAAMKVTTEACILGAWAFHEAPTRILDIGTGTGLLALMMAQRYPQSHIDAVEIEKNAFNEATQNIQQSQFAPQIHLYHTAIQTFSQNIPYKYDLIICNPPFYKNHLQRNHLILNQALHQITLHLHEVAQICSFLLNEKGLAWILLPPFTMDDFVNIALKNRLFPQSCLHVYHSPCHALLRKIVAFGKEKKSCSTYELFIKDEQENYTTTFKNLLKEFYLHF